MKDPEKEEMKVPKISLDDFFLGADQVKRITRNQAAKMPTKQLRRNLKTAKLPTNGTRDEMVADMTGSYETRWRKKACHPRPRVKMRITKLQTIPQL